MLITAPVTVTKFSVETVPVAHEDPDKQDDIRAEREHHTKHNIRDESFLGVDCHAMALLSLLQYYCSGRGISQHCFRVVGTHYS